MEKITRKEVCSELGIDDFVLSQYEDFLCTAEKGAPEFSHQVAQLMIRTHDLISKGLSLNDIKQLIYCSERFSDLVPALKSFQDFAPQNHLLNNLEEYQAVITEFSFREEQYQERIKNLEENLEILQNELDKNGIAQEQIEAQVEAKNQLQGLLTNKEEELKEVQAQNDELCILIKDKDFQLEEKEEEINQLKLDLNHFLNQKNNPGSRSAIDIQALLTRKEKEVALKYQREIFDLKKQVDFMMEKKEEEWYKSKNI